MHPFDRDMFVAELTESMLSAARSNAHGSEDATWRDPRLRHDDFSYQYAYTPIDFDGPLDQVVDPDDVRSQLGDVELSVDRYAKQDERLQQFGLPTPVVAVGGDLIPVDLGVADWRYVPAHSLEGIVRAFHDAPSTLQATVVESRSAEKGFRRGLNRFIKTRLFPITPPPTSPSTAAGGYQFTVTTLTPGLRIHYSPAYFVNQRKVFGLPSTPVRASLQPGRYIFGAYLPDPGYWSSDEYDVPGTTDTAHLDV